MRVVVLPLPAGAITCAGPSGSVAAARCSGSRASSSGATIPAAALATAMRPRIRTQPYRRMIGRLSGYPVAARFTHGDRSPNR